MNTQKPADQPIAPLPVEAAPHAPHARVPPPRIRPQSLISAAQIPRDVKRAYERLCAWRMLCSQDFVERLRPRSISELTLRMGERKWGVASMTLEMAGWTCVLRTNTAFRQAWIPPIDEEFSKLDQKYVQGFDPTLLKDLEEAAHSPGLPRGGDMLMRGTAGLVAYATNRQPRDPIVAAFVARRKADALAAEKAAAEKAEAAAPPAPR